MGVGCGCERWLIDGTSEAEEGKGITLVTARWDVNVDADVQAVGDSAAI